jgi:mono/diheme cytochrome c family protein
VLLGIALTGVIGLGGMLKQGPARAFLSYATGVQALQWHNLLAFLVLAMICLHLAGVAYESWRGHENLVAAMITGDKTGLVEAAPVARVRAHPLGALAIVLVVGTLGVNAVFQLSGRPAPLVPPAITDPVFGEQCGACHVAFPGSLASAFSWAHILQDLQHHFGADASLGPDQVADGSLRITDTPGWRARHRAITVSTFAAKPIYRSSNCVACHADTASGMFAPQNIAIPPIEAPKSRVP